MHSEIKLKPLMFAIVEGKNTRQAMYRVDGWHCTVTQPNYE